MMTLRIEHPVPEPTTIPCMYGGAGGETEAPFCGGSRALSRPEQALADSRGRVYGREGVAAKLGIPRSTLELRIRSLKIDKNRFRAP